MASPGYRRCPQDTAYPQDTDSVLRIPRYPQDTAGVLRYNYRHDAAVSSGYRVPRMPPVSQDANSHFQTSQANEFSKVVPFETLSGFKFKKKRVLRATRIARTAVPFDTLETWNPCSPVVLTAPT